MVVMIQLKTTKNNYMKEEETIRITTPPLHEHRDEYGVKRVCGKVFCPKGYVGIEVIKTQEKEQKYCDLSPECNCDLCSERKENNLTQDKE